MTGIQERIRQVRALARSGFSRARVVIVERIWPALKEMGWVIRETVDQFSIDQAWQRSAALAFYMMLSLVPALLIVIRVAGVLYEVDAAETEIVQEVEAVAGSASADTIRGLLQGVEASTQASGNLLTTIVGVVTIFVGATSVFTNLKHALNTLWGIDPKRVRGLVNFVRTRLIAFLFVTAIGLIIVILLLADAALILTSQYLHDFLPQVVDQYIQPILDFSYIRLLFRLVMITTLITIIFKVLPDAQIAWRDAWIGGIATALLMTTGQLLFGVYLKYSTVGSAFGAAGSLVVLLVWVYYTALAFFYGVEFTYVYANHYGSSIRHESTSIFARARNRLRRASPNVPESMDS